MSEATSIKQLIQQLMPTQIGVIIGKVISVNPLNVQAVNDSKLILHKGNLIVPGRLTLKAGEYVYMLSYAGGKKYYALDKAVI